MRPQRAIALTLAIALFLQSCALHAEQPQVLLIGDSISLGYTPHVIQSLQGVANVRHHKGNAQHTGTGLKQIDQWLGDTEWDVIHFNWGLWDLCYRHPDSKVQGHRDKERGTLTTSLKDYEQNLEALVTRLEQTGAILIWANITTVPEGEAGRQVGDDDRYNAVALKVMQKHNVRVNDLNSLTDTFTTDLFTKPGDVHYTQVGYKKIADQVVREIRKALEPHSK